MRILLISIIFLFQFSSFSQQITIGDTLKIKFKKVKLIKSGNVIINETKNKVKKAKKSKHIYIFCQIESLNKSKINIDAFSVLDTKNKLRFRLTYYQGWKGKSTIGLKAQSTAYLKKQILKANGKAYDLLPDYDPTKKDDFDKYTFEGYENMELPTYFGTNIKNSIGEVFNKKQLLNSVLYYSDSKFDKFVAAFNFPFIEGSEDNIEFYYGNSLISKLDFK